MTDYTPDTPTVKAAYTRAMRDTFVAAAWEHDAEFERWLERHDAEVAEKCAEIADTEQWTFDEGDHDEAAAWYASRDIAATIRAAYSKPEMQRKDEG